MNYNQKRQTGRTTRMLIDAIHYTTLGKKVFIVVASYAQAINLKSNINCNIINDLDINFILHNSPTLDWNTLTIKGIKDCVVLVDHYVIESKFSKILDMFYTYN